MLFPPPGAPSMSITLDKEEVVVVQLVVMVQRDRRD